MSAPKLRTATLKIDRAAKHVEELNELLREKRPFSYVLETNTHTRQRATYAKKNEAVIDAASVIAGDALHGLRAALDHAYWQIVRAHAGGDPRAERAIQFPFSETAARLEEAVKNRLAHRVSPEFFSFIMSLRPHGEPGGNDLLYLLHEQDAVDKHRDLIPTGDYTRLSSDIIRQQVPDFPPGLFNCGFGQNRRDVGWPLDFRVALKMRLVGQPPRILEQQLDVPVEITFNLGGTHYPRPLVPTLHQITTLTREVVTGMEAFA